MPDVWEGAMSQTATPTPTRTEVEAVSDALCSLLVAHLVPVERVDDACRVVGIARSDLNDARIRYERGRLRPARPVETLPTVAGPAASPEPSRRLSGAWRGTNGSTYDGVVPRLSERRNGCSGSGTAGRGSAAAAAAPSSLGRGGETTTGAGAAGATSSPRPDGLDSAPTSPGSGGTAPTTSERFCVACTYWKPEADFCGDSRRCRECTNALKRDRYLSVSKAEAIERATIRYVVASGDPVTHCGMCGEELGEGEEVVARGVALHHARHDR